MIHVDYARSAQLGKDIRAAPKMCYLNAYRGVAHVQGALYVEGYVALETTPAPIAHGWIELPTSETILDPTPGYCDEATAALAYFAGQRWTLRECLATQKAHRYGLTLPLSDFRADTGCNVGLAPDHEILEEWRRAVCACHAYRAARHREQHGTPLFGSDSREAEWLAQELSVWAIEHPGAAGHVDVAIHRWLARSGHTGA